MSTAPAPAIELGFATNHFSPKRLEAGPPLLELVHAGADVGFDFVALDRSSLYRAKQEGELTEVAAVCAERLPCRELHGLIVGDEDWEWDDQLEQALYHADVFRPEVIAVIPRGLRDDDDLERVKAAASQLKQVFPAVQFGLEFSPLFTVKTIADGLLVCTELDDPAFGLIVDSWHFFLGDSDWHDLASLTDDQIAAVHFNDHGAVGPGGLGVEKERRELPGEGRFPLTRFAAEIRATGYAGGVTCEVISERLRDLSPRAFIEAVHTSSRPYWSPTNV